MSLQLIRDADGRVTIINSTTGKSEVIATGTVGRPAQRTVGAAEELPAHSWSKLA